MNDSINRKGAINAVCTVLYPDADKMNDAKKVLKEMPPAHKKGYTKADYIMALHKEYGCGLARAEEAHQKALEYLRNTSMIKG